MFSEGLCCCTPSCLCFGQVGWRPMFLQQGRVLLVPWVTLGTFQAGSSPGLSAVQAAVQSCCWAPGGTWISWLCAEAACPRCSLCVQPCCGAWRRELQSCVWGFGEQSPGCAVGEVWGCGHLQSPSEAGFCRACHQAAEEQRLPLLCAFPA